MPDYKHLAAKEAFKDSQLPYFAGDGCYRCTFCGGEIPDGVSVSPVIKRGKLAGVVASSDSNPSTPGVWVHRCGAGLKEIPEDLKEHDVEQNGYREAFAKGTS